MLKENVSQSSTATDDKIRELVEDWARGQVVSTTDFFWLIDKAKLADETQKKYNSLVSMFDQVASMTIGAWERMVSDK